MHKIWNYFLLVIIASLLSLIIYEEINYNRFARKNFTIEAVGVDPVDLEVIKLGWSHEKFKKLDSTLFTNENYKKIENGFLPKSVLIQWFNYTDNKFYEYNGDLPYKDLQKNIKHENPLISLIINKSNNFTLTVNDKNVQNLRAKEIEKPWFKKTINREQAVFFTNNTSFFVPQINVTSTSKLINSRLYNQEIVFSKNKKYYYSSDSLVGKSLVDKDGIQLTTNIFSELYLSLKNPKFRVQHSNNSFDRDLNIYLNLNKDHLYKILKDHPSELYYFIIKLDEKDSVKSIQLQKDEKTFNLPYKVSYTLTT